MGFRRVTHRKTGAGVDCYNDAHEPPQRICWYPAQPFCPNPGPYSFVDNEVKDTKVLGDIIWGWLVYAPCYYFPEGGKLCFHGIGVEQMSDPNKVCDTR